ncbi:M23 family metallopeptidase [Desulfosporosinus metallidurans]|uniref:Peptidase M23 n=1 Tax=Desulfosporosinus metallidurans TaxID=1888891 RepID=A0A1Q8QVK8_9FIRM|nr:M23 family metallopeptidase [Desulfosporosinus metallidurans]OLN31360.1 peptidase M23 [Desulfosporosinus metallidurans]
MADPATLALIARAVIPATTDKRTWKVIGAIIAALLTPVILMVVVILSLLSATASHNNAAIDLTFHGGAISSQMPADYADYIRNMRDSFSELDTAIGNISTELESGSLDSTRVKAIFYALFFGADSPSRDSDDYRAFADCFVRYEIRSNEATGTSSKVAIPLTSLPEIYSNLESTLGRTITSEDKANASEIYNRILYGDIPTEGDGLQNWVNTITANPAEVPFIGGDFISPLGSSWRSMVTSEFGYRSDPIHPTAENFHSGIDLGAPKGTDIHAANGGTVLFVRYKTTGYGYHLAIDHGGGIVTLYGHCSKILVTEGQAVRQGEVIAQVGSTGKSTGNHLHFEVIVDGTPQNPRSYLP